MIIIIRIFDEEGTEMLSVQRMTPFFTRKEEFRLRLVFAYQYFSIVKGDELFHFIPRKVKKSLLTRKAFK